MDRDTYMKQQPFAVPQPEKDAFFQQEIKDLTEHHRRSCQAYDDICNGLDTADAYLPVACFKDLELRSVEMDQVVRQVTSSGTTGQRVSRIFLDAETSELQRRALASITGDFIGEHRIPMLIIDSPDVLRDRRKFSARGAGILGFSMMSSRRYYALDENMQLDWDSIETFMAKAQEGPTFAFGFTFMIWAYFVSALRAAGKRLDLPGCTLIHGGGWKKLQDQRVSDAVFRQALLDTCGISRVSDYYGMAEQTGSIFMQCPCGHLHASIFSDIEILRTEDFSPCEAGEWGLIALRSWLPRSYPGHQLLTEDWGRILGTDDCPCGRKGKYFEVQGRIRKAEIRGCSDTFEQGGASGPAGGDDLRLLAGHYPVADRTRPAFDPLVCQFLEDLSGRFMKDPTYRQYPDVYALGFWCRPAHIRQLQKRQGQAAGGIGTVLHIAPSNMPTMFAYSWLTALLAGCSSVVRLSQKEHEISRVILQGIDALLREPAYAPLAEENAFVTFPRDHKALAEISGQAAARMIWGGDATITHIQSVPAARHTRDIAFPDKYSIAVLDPGWVNGLSEADLQTQAHLFYRDTYGADQNACSSPRTVFWLGEGPGPQAAEQAFRAADRWWGAVAHEAAQYDLQSFMATEKYRQLTCSYARHKGLSKVRRFGNRLYVIGADDLQEPLWHLEGTMGIFYEIRLDDMGQLMPYLGEKIQTIVYSGSDPAQLYQAVRQAGCPGVDRVVHLGEALEFDTIWDRKDLIGTLCEAEKL